MEIAIDQKGGAVVDQRIQKLTEYYRMLRDKIADLEARKTKVQEEKTKVAAAIMDFLQKNGIENLRTASGTCYISERTTASVADPKAFMDFVIEAKNWELLDKRANPVRCTEFTKEHGFAPPGVNLNTTKTLGVRKANGGNNGAGDSTD